jgi:hypothetical protein
MGGVRIDEMEKGRGGGGGGREGRGGAHRAQSKQRHADPPLSLAPP